MNDKELLYNDPAEDFIYSQKFDAVIGLSISMIIIVIMCVVMYFTSQPEDAAVEDVSVEFPVSELSDEIVEVEEVAVETVVEEQEEAEAEDEVVVEEVAVETASAPVTTQAAYSNYESYDNGSDLTKSGGVNYHNGRKETWYSSNVLYHYRTGEWTVDSEGFYRTNDGYYVVAAGDMPHGTTFEGSKGTCIVLDAGCANGITDYYVAW